MINQQFAELQGYLRDEKGLPAELLRLNNGGYLITVKNVPIRDGWNQQVVDVLFIAPPGYPAARPDCFSGNSSTSLGQRNDASKRKRWQSNSSRYSSRISTHVVFMASSNVGSQRG